MREDEWDDGTRMSVREAERAYVLGAAIRGPYSVDGPKGKGSRIPATGRVATACLTAALFEG